MVTCKHCSTPNSLDSTFCKRCGTALPADDVQIAQEKLEQLIAQGNTAFNEGRTDEAMAIAESACASNPSSTPALSLKTLCHERRGELAEALECAELIVELNPDSELDKIKRNQLRNKLSMTAQLAASQGPDRRTALIGAVSAVVLFACVGIGIAKMNMRNAAKQESFVSSNSSTGSPLSTPSTQQNSPNSASNVQQSQVQTQNSPQNQQNDGGQNQFNEAPLRRSAPNGLLPREGALDGQDVIVGGDQPITPPNPLRGQIGSTAAPTEGGTGTLPATNVKLPAQGKETGSEDPNRDPQPTADSTKAAQNNDPGVVEISLSHGSKRPNGPTSGGSDLGAGGAAALDRIGIQRYQLGSYGAAATSFEQALRAGGDPISINQWLGRCYGNLGRKSDQIDAYKKCVSACQSALNSGTGNKDRIKATLDTCQQQLKVLQGN